MGGKDFSTMGIPMKLLRKTTMVEACDEPERLPVYTLTFEIPPPLTDDDDDDDDDPTSKKMKAIQKHHSEIRIELGDVIKMVIPNYKPKSYSVSDLRVEDNELDVTVKVYPNGRASGFLDRLQIGDTIRSFGKSANRYRNHHHHHHHEEENYNNGEHICIIVYGVGITEGLPVARKELERMARIEKDGCDSSSSSKVTILWAGRTMDDTFWHDQIDDLKEKYGKNKFEIFYLCSREKEEDEEKFIRGRVNQTVFKEVFHLSGNNEEKEKNPKHLFLSVGTKEMMKMTYDMLSSMGYPSPEYQLIPKK